MDAPLATPRRTRHADINAPLVIGAVLLGLAILSAALAPVLAPYSPVAIDLSAVRKPPSLVHLFGTDGVGRDVFTRVLYGGRVSLTVAGIGMIGSLSVGTIMGLLGAFGGRLVEVIVSRLIDIQLAFPYVLLAIAVTSAVKPSIPVLILLMVLAGWAGAARVVRGIALQERGKDYVKAAAVLGIPKIRVALRHVLPTIVPSLVVLAAMQMAAMIVFEATLSFLGMGVQPPTPSWGGIMLDGKNYITTAWWMTSLPGVALVITSLSLVLIADGLQRRFNRKAVR
ncbi:peptide ABC transporter permease [Kaistia algarum]|uniref:ABC transporter permease n=1 Tax=Kaistia algarum TaxID=2083279 RepID=UPI000CE850D4|nr:ABC transporter permease [Kaistia algarum]MCX5513928.1 ABC transporter permease [Kaistia algarum]PPE77559.1 peptide ABC transporter permease [Kaistia algarum]